MTSRSFRPLPPPPAAALLLAIVATYVRASHLLDCASSGMPACTSDEDCTDWEGPNMMGMDPWCGDVVCDYGTCTFDAHDDERCYDDTYVYCDGDDTLCDRGPRGLPFIGTCSGWKNRECVYRWCPCGCTDDDDCKSRDADLYTCGDVWCNTTTRMCHFDAWEDEIQTCIDTYFVECDGDDGMCTKGPSGSEGTCTGFEYNECVYSWCPVPAWKTLEREQSSGGGEEETRRRRRPRPLGMVVCRSEADYDTTWNTLLQSLDANPNIRLIAEVDHAQNAAGAGLDLKGRNRVAVFGNPNLGTPLMQAGRTAGLDLPQKIHVWEEEEEEEESGGDIVYVGYNPVEYLDARHGVGDEARTQLDVIAGALANFASTAAGGTTCDVQSCPPEGLAHIERDNGIVTERSGNDFDATYARLLQAIDASPARVMFEVDHGENSNGVLPPTRLVVFGNPNVGTPLMQSSASMGIDLPVKVLVWTDEEEDGHSAVKVSYNDVDFLASRHGLCDVDESLDAMRGAIDNFVSFATVK